MQAVEIFRPGRITVSLSVNADVPACTWGHNLSTPSGYSVQGTTSQHFACGGCIFHYSLACTHKADGLPSSPSTVLDSIFSAMSVTGLLLASTLQWLVFKPSTKFL